jgi:predicted GNAT superfamily acetyltransferase
VKGLVIRPLAGLRERQDCVALQQRVWGHDFADRVPASILMIVQETGGVVSGAFSGNQLVGFVFGITGFRDARGIHWSDMLAVDPEFRGRGIGYRLKLHQREQLLGAGVERARWTFDPLEARNAHLNLRRLGATASEYRRDVYGASNSPLHAGIGTDRLVVDWAIASSRVERYLQGMDDRDTDACLDAPVLNPPVMAGGRPRPGPHIAEPGGSIVRVAIPGDIQELKRADLATAVAWRRSVRTALETAFGGGYMAVDLLREGAVPTYILDRGFER